MPGIAKILFDKVFVSLDTMLMYKYVCIQLFIAFYLALFTIIFELFECNLNLQIANKIKANYLRRLLHSQISFFKTFDAGYIVKRMMEDTNAIANGIAKLISIICNIFMIVLFSGILFYVERWLFTFYVISVLTSFIWMLLWIIPIHYCNMKIGDAYSNLYKLFFEILQGIKDVKLQNLHSIIIGKIARTNQNVKNSLFGNAFLSICMWQYAPVFYGIAYITILVYGIQKIESGNMSIGMLLGLLSLIFYLLDPIQKIYSTVGVVQAGIAAAQRLSVLRTASIEKTGKIKLEKVNDGVYFENISFSYDDKANVLDSINIKIPVGSKVAIVGKTGSGKTTLIQLLLKLYSGYSGSIIINGNSLENYTIESIRNKIVFITQDNQLFQDSIRNNIDLTQALTDTEIADILKKVNLDGVISKQMKGIDSVIGDDGLNFSGGERQRIAIARSMAVNPDVVVLDEITASLDPQNEEQIMDNLLDHFDGKTIISISHRLSTIQHFDYIYVLKEGKLVESGSYKELVSKKGEFYRNFALDEVTVEVNK
jgi:ABC-type multidrug transport system fused ATPase/permease subunit